MCLLVTVNSSSEDGLCTGYAVQYNNGNKTEHTDLFQDSYPYKTVYWQTDV